MYYSTKLINGFSTCFRQWKAKGTHCSYLHGYDIEFKVVFAAKELDHRNWVQDFGFLSRSQFKFDGKQIKDWFKYMFDHTTVIAANDPYLKELKKLNDMGVIQLRVIDSVGCERFAELVYNVLKICVEKESKNRVFVESVECIENGKNSAIFKPNKL